MVQRFYSYAPTDIAALLAAVKAYRALLAELHDYTKRLEGAYSVWATTRPSMARWPECAPDLGARIDAALANQEAPASE